MLRPSSDLAWSGRPPGPPPHHFHDLLHDQDALPCCSLQIHIVHARASPAHHLQLLGRVDDIRGHLGGRADNKAFAVLRQKKKHLDPQIWSLRPRKALLSKVGVPAGWLALDTFRERKARLCTHIGKPPLSLMPGFTSKLQP